jgi:glycerophosphoryl diester phosphodiesterase
VSARAFAREGRAFPLIYGHRGTRRGAPENTLLAMQRALTQGADAIEIDVRLCASGEVVVVHDPDLRRVASADVAVAALPLAALQRYDLGDGERVPTLGSALDLVLGAGRLINVELKPDVPDRAALAAAVARTIAARAAAERERVIFSSFSSRLCELLLAALPGASVAVLFERAGPPLLAGLAAVHPSQQLVDAAALAAWRQAGQLVNVWTVNDAARARELALSGVDGIITDDVPLVLGALTAAQDGR